MNEYDPKTITDIEEDKALIAVRSFVSIVGPILNRWNEIFVKLGLHDQP